MSSINITSFGQGQVSATKYTVPPYGDINVNFKIKLQVVTPDGLKKMDSLVKSLLEASKQHEYEQLSKSKASGGISFFAFWGGKASASTETTKRTMDSWGLSEANQEKIVTDMLKLSQKMNTFDYNGSIKNVGNHDVSGDLMAFTMDATINQGNETKELKMIAPQVSLKPNDGGDNIPLTSPLF